MLIIVSSVGFHILIFSSVYYLNKFFISNIEVDDIH
jgi:hypothetical protein